MKGLCKVVLVLLVLVIAVVGRIGAPVKEATGKLFEEVKELPDKESFGWLGPSVSRGVP